MVIREEQAQVFAGKGEDSFVDRLVQRVKETHPEQVRGYDDARIRALTRGCMQRARSYGLATEAEIANFTMLMFAMGPEFDSDPVVQAILTDERTPASQKVTRLSTHVPPEVWMRIAQRYDVRQWAKVGS